MAIAQCGRSDGFVLGSFVLCASDGAGISFDCGPEKVAVVDGPCEDVEANVESMPPEATEVDEA